MPSASEPLRLVVQVRLDRLCENLSLRLGMRVDADRARRWLVGEHFEAIDDIWLCTPDALAALEPDEVNVIGQWRRSTL